MRVNDAAERLDISRKSLYGLKATGEVRVVRLGQSIRVLWQELERLADGAA